MLVKWGLQDRDSGGQEPKDDKQIRKANVKAQENGRQPNLAGGWDGWKKNISKRLGVPPPQIKALQLFSFEFNSLTPAVARRKWKDANGFYRTQGQPEGVV